MTAQEAIGLIEPRPSSRCRSSPTPDEALAARRTDHPRAGPGRASGPTAGSRRTSPRWGAPTHGERPARPPASGLGRHRRGLRGSPPGRGGLRPLPELYAFAMEPYTRVAPAEWPAPASLVRTAPVHGPRRPRADASTCRCPGCAWSCPTSAAATGPVLHEGRAADRARAARPRPVELALDVEAAILPPAGPAPRPARDRLRRRRPACWAARSTSSSTRAPTRKTARSSAQGGEPLLRAVPVPRLDVRGSVRLHQHGAGLVFAASARRRSRWRPSSSWTRRPSGWASTRSRCGCATCSSPARRPARQARHRRRPRRRPALAAESTGLDRRRRGHGMAFGISASDAGSEPITTSVVRVHPDGSVSHRPVRPRSARAAGPPWRRSPRTRWAPLRRVDVCRATPARSPTTAPPARAGRRRSWASRSSAPRGRAAAAPALAAEALALGAGDVRGAGRRGDRREQATGARSCAPGSAARRRGAARRTSSRRGDRGRCRRSGRSAASGSTSRSTRRPARSRSSSSSRWATSGGAINPAARRGRRTSVRRPWASAGRCRGAVYDDAHSQRHVFDYRVPRFTDLPPRRPCSPSAATGSGPTAPKAAVRARSTPWPRDRHRRLRVRWAAPAGEFPSPRNGSGG